MKLKDIGINACAIGELPVKRVFHGDVFIWALLTTIWDGETWSNGEPTSEMVAIINGPLNTAEQNNLVCDYLQNNSSIVIASGTFLTANQIHNQGGVVVEDKGNLLQHGNASFYTGNAIVVKSKTTPVYRLDFTYWSAPVNGFSLFAVSPLTLFDKYNSWNPLTQAWVIHRSNTDHVLMESGKGYTVRAPQNFPLEGSAGAVAQIYEATFTGVPNTGDISIPVNLKSSGTGDSYNLLGNPYPSVFNWDLFWLDNHSIIQESAYFWVPKQIESVGGGVYSYPANYAVYTPLGGVRVNAEMPRPNGVMDIARAIFITAKQNANVIFKDTHRKNAVNPLDIERNRYWLNCKNATGNLFSETLVGYVEGYDDHEFSAINFNTTNAMYMSVLDGTKIRSIMSRKTPFDATDKEVLTLKVTTAGNHTISLANFEGLFDLTGIYLVDKLLNVTTNLKDGDYTFNSAAGTFNTRFEIIYQLP